ncbi:MAG: O-acetyl-ADP-ribose deacetylase [Nitrospinae bacterium]|nr:O-acetyl-ADP-ribose deacetylase [Nitrospinota bacterium]
MRLEINGAFVELAIGDITDETSDAIVNAANSALAGGSGVDGAIHRAGGPQIMEECRKIGGCPTGTAVITTGGRLKAKYVIHTVGPIYEDGLQNEPKLLANAYKSSMALAIKHELKSVSFPSISTGAYGYPLQEAADVALKTVAEFLLSHGRPNNVRFVLFSQTAFDAYKSALEKLKTS